MTNEQERRRQVADATVAAEATMRTQTVPVNMFETDGALVVGAPLPAVMPDDVTIELAGATLRFWAHRGRAAPRNYLVHEWDYGCYERELQLPIGHVTDTPRTYLRAHRRDRRPRFARPLPIE